MVKAQFETRLLALLAERVSLRASQEVTHSKAYLSALGKNCRNRCSVLIVLNGPLKGLAGLYNVADVLETSATEAFAILSTAEGVIWSAVTIVVGTAGGLRVEEVFAVIWCTVGAAHELLSGGSAGRRRELRSKGAGGDLRDA